jgi:hypothetical protein
MGDRRREWSMGSTEGSRPEWEKPEIVGLDEAEDAAGAGPCTPGSSDISPFPCIPGFAPILGCAAGTVD